jgi:hypothetical protein
MDFLLMMKENKGQVTKGDQKMYGSVAYYVMINYLNSIGLIYCNGFNDKNQKRWIFSEKGRKIADLLKEIQDIYNEKVVDNENNNSKTNRRKA